MTSRRQNPTFDDAQKEALIAESIEELRGVRRSKRGIRSYVRYLRGYPDEIDIPDGHFAAEKYAASLLTRVKSGDTEAGYELSALCAKWIEARHRLTKSMQRHVFSILEESIPWTDTEKIGTRRVSKASLNEDYIPIAIEVKRLMDEYGLFAQRSPGSVDRISACFIVAEALTRLGYPDRSEDTVGKVWLKMKDSVESCDDAPEEHSEDSKVPGA